MEIRQAYNVWASQYDTNINKTRDLEAHALRDALADISFTTCLEIGCGTGKNTEWLINKAVHVTAVDISEEMLIRAKEKIDAPNVKFEQADITGTWLFCEKLYDLINFSLILEHIDNLNHVFRQAADALVPGGHVYIGELHPFKQYQGSKARFDTANGQQVVQCFNHHISDFIQAAKKYGLVLVDVNEYFDDGDRNGAPRILTILFKKPEGI